jgi:probable phosphoglycerate mutase
MSNIHFIRHAQSLGNIGQRTKDIESIDLSELGYQQAKELVNRLPYQPDLIIHSPYIRTHLTAQPTIDHYNITNIECWDEVKELTYLDTIKWTDSTHEEREPVINAFWDRCDPDYRDGVCETFNETLNRVKKTVEKLETIKDKKVLVFTHGQFLQIMRLYLIHGDNTQKIMSSFREEDKKNPIQNAQIYTYESLINL